MIIIAWKVRSPYEIYGFISSRHTFRSLVWSSSFKTGRNKWRFVCWTSAFFCTDRCIANDMASVKWLQWIFLEFFSFTMCLAKYFTLVLPHADKSSTVIPIGVLTSQTKLHCATLCDLVPSCYSFTYSIDSLADNCRLLPSTAKSSTFTVSAAGNKHYERKVDCKCIVIHLS